MRKIHIVVCLLSVIVVFLLFAVISMTNNLNRSKIELDSAIDTNTELESEFETERYYNSVTIEGLYDKIDILKNENIILNKKVTLYESDLDKQIDSVMNHINELRTLYMEAKTWYRAGSVEKTNEALEEFFTKDFTYELVKLDDTIEIIEVETELDESVQ